MHGHKQPEFFWKDNTKTKATQEYIDNSFLSQVVEELMRGHMLLDLKFTKKETLVKHVKAGGSLGCCNDEKVELIRRGKKSEKWDHTVIGL